MAAAVGAYLRLMLQLSMAGVVNGLTRSCTADCYQRHIMPQRGSEWSLEALNPIFSLLQYSNSFEEAFRKTKTFCSIANSLHQCYGTCTDTGARVLRESLRPTKYLCKALDKERALINCIYLHTSVFEARCQYEKDKVEKLLNANFTADILTDMDGLNKICKVLKSLEECHLQQTDAYCHSSRNAFWRRLLGVTQQSFVNVVRMISSRRQLPSSCTDSPYLPTRAFSPITTSVVLTTTSTIEHTPTTTTTTTSDRTVPNAGAMNDTGVVSSNSSATFDNTSWLAFYRLRAIAAVFMAVALHLF